MWRSSVKDYRLALKTLIIVAILVAVRVALWRAGIEGMNPSAFISSIIGGGVFVLGLVIAGTLSDYKDAQRVPSDLAANLFVVLRESEAIHRVWGKPNLSRLRNRCIAIVDGLRKDIDAGNSRECEKAIEDLGDSLLEMEDTDVPANYVVRLRSEQAAMRKTAMRVYQIQREEFLPSAYAMIVSFVALIIAFVMFTKVDNLPVTAVTLGFLSFFFIYLLFLLNTINQPFKVGQERGDDDVSLFQLYEFVVHARFHDQDLNSEQVVALAEAVEELEGGQTVEADAHDEAGVVHIDETLAAAIEVTDEVPDELAAEAKKSVN